MHTLARSATLCGPCSRTSTILQESSIPRWKLRRRSVEFSAIWSIQKARANVIKRWRRSCSGLYACVRQSRTGCSEFDECEHAKCNLEEQHLTMLHAKTCDIARNAWNLYSRNNVIVSIDYRSRCWIPRNKQPQICVIVAACETL